MKAFMRFLCSIVKLSQGNRKMNRRDPCGIIPLDVLELLLYGSDFRKENARYAQCIGRTVIRRLRVIREKLILQRKQTVECGS